VRGARPSWPSLDYRPVVPRACAVLQVRIAGALAGMALPETAKMGTAILAMGCPDGKVQVRAPD
jgi:hypothetical protein